MTDQQDPTPGGGAPAGGGFHKHRLLVAIAAGVGLIGVFLPWATTPFGNATGLNAGAAGMLCLALLGTAVAMAFIGNKAGPLVGGPKITAGIVGAIAGAIALLNIINFNSEVSEGGSEAAAIMGAMGVGLGFGIYVVVAGGIATAILSFIGGKK